MHFFYKKLVLNLQKTEMDLKNINIELDLAIQSIDQIIVDEDFAAYREVKMSLYKTKEFLSEHSFSEAKKELLFSIRLLMEAPTKDKQLGFDALSSVDMIYKKICSLLTN